MYNIHIYIYIYVYIVCCYLDIHWWMLVASVPEEFWTVKESKHLKIQKSRWRNQQCNLPVSGCERALLPWHWLAAYSFVEVVLRFERRFGVCLMEIKNGYVKNYCFLWGDNWRVGILQHQFGIWQEFGAKSHRLWGIVGIYNGICNQLDMMCGFVSHEAKRKTNVFNRKTYAKSANLWVSYFQSSPF